MIFFDKLKKKKEDEKYNSIFVIENEDICTSNIITSSFFFQITGDEERESTMIENKKNSFCTISFS